MATGVEIYIYICIANDLLYFGFSRIRHLSLDCNECGFFCFFCLCWAFRNC